MSVRRIPKNYRNLTGLAASSKAQSPFFESTLERDCYTIFEFDQNVLTYDVQPVCIPWVAPDGKERTYTPDALVQYRPNTCPYSFKDTVLCEVKYRKDIHENWEDYKSKFKAAITYANIRGWRFKLITELEIRTDYMENARFLIPFTDTELDDSHAQMLLHRLAELREASVSGLVNSIFNDKWARAELLPSLWHLIAKKRVSTDLTLPLTMSSSIWLGDI